MSYSNNGEGQLQYNCIRNNVDVSCKNYRSCVDIQEYRIHNKSVFKYTWDGPARSIGIQKTRTGTHYVSLDLWLCIQAMAMLVGCSDKKVSFQ